MKTYEETIDKNMMAGEPASVGYSSHRARRINRTYEAMIRLKGSLILVNPAALDL